jgi:hypothetical protein
MYQRNPKSFSRLSYEGYSEPETLGTRESQIYPQIMFSDYLPLSKVKIEEGNRWFYQNRSQLPSELKNLRMQDLILTVRTNMRALTFVWILQFHKEGPRLGSGIFVSSSTTPKRNDPEEGYYEDITASLSLQGFGIYPAILRLMRQLLGPLRSDIALTSEARKAWQRAGGEFNDQRGYLQRNPYLRNSDRDLDR